MQLPHQRKPLTRRSRSTAAGNKQYNTKEWSMDRSTCRRYTNSAAFGCQKAKCITIIWSVPKDGCLRVSSFNQWQKSYRKRSIRTVRDTNLVGMARGRRCVGRTAPTPATTSEDSKQTTHMLVMVARVEVDGQDAGNTHIHTSTRREAKIAVKKYMLYLSVWIGQLQYVHHHCQAFRIAVVLRVF